MKYKHNYGYKICYCEEGKTSYVRYFMTYTHRDAIKVRNSYVRYPPTIRDNGRKLKKPKWRIIPINRREVIDGIWREVPF